MNSERAARMESGCVASPARPQAYPRTGIASFKFITLEENFFNLSFLFYYNQFFFLLSKSSSTYCFLSLSPSSSSYCYYLQGERWRWEGYVACKQENIERQVDGTVGMELGYMAYIREMGVVDTSQLGALGLNGTQRNVLRGGPTRAFGKWVGTREYYWVQSL